MIVHKNKHKNKQKFAKENFNSHSAIIPNQKSDLFINWVNSNSEKLGISADICKLQKHNKHYDKKCEILKVKKVNLA